MALMTPQGLRARAYSLVQSAKKSGKLRSHIGLECADCGADAEGYDHRDYTKPLDVEPVCLPCNGRRGQGYPRTNSPPIEVPECMVSDVEDWLYEQFRLKEPWEQGIPT